MLTRGRSGAVHEDWFADIYARYFKAYPPSASNAHTLATKQRKKSLDIKPKAQLGTDI